MAVRCQITWNIISAQGNRIITLSFSFHGKLVPASLQPFSLYLFFAPLLITFMLYHPHNLAYSSAP